MKRILIWDAETSPILGWVWQRYEANVLRVEQESHLLSIAWKWYGDKKTFVKALPDYKTYKKDTHNDYELAQDLHALFEEADVIIAHNGDSFDNKVAYARFILHGFAPPPAHKSIDTLKIARKHFKFSSNKLDDLGALLGVGRKVRTGGKELWFDCMDGEKKAWRKMKKYNKQDVDLLERVYEVLKPWHSTHPSFVDEQRVNDEEPKCLVCNSPRMGRRGKGLNLATWYWRYQCQDCGKWNRGNNMKKV